MIFLLPTLNEETGLKKILPKISSRYPKAEILVIDGHSDDRTLNVAKKYKCKILIQRGKGKGMGFRTFLEDWKIIEKEHYVMLDADDSYDPLEAYKFEKLLIDHEVIIGHRFGKVHSIRDIFHFIGNKMISLTALFLFLKWNPDVCTGYWGFRGSALKKLDIRATKFDLEADLYTNSIKKGLNYKIIDVGYCPRVGERKLRSYDAFLIIKRLFINRFRSF